MGLAGNGAVEREPVLIGGEWFGRGVGAGERRILEGEGSAAGTLSNRDAVADGGGVQMVQRVSGFQVEPGLFGGFDEEPVSGERVSLRMICWMRRLSGRSRA